jgi:pimeloyl-ACP methyl ester carboxylesterase
MRRALTCATGLILALLADGCISYDPAPKKIAKPDQPDSAHQRKPAFARFGTNKVYYVTTGKGPRTIVFVHGWASNGNFWNEQVPALEDKARLIFIDLPGHGRSDKPEVNYSIDFLADAVLAVMQSAKAAPATLVGHSMGVAVICRVYAQAPEKVAALVAVDGSLRMNKVSPEDARKYVAAYGGPDYREQVKRSVTAMFPTPKTERLRAQVFEQMINTPQHVLISTLQNSFDTNAPSWQLDRVDVPLLILNARSAAWTSDYEAHVRSLSAQVDYRTFEKSGHFLMLEKPLEFNTALTGMLARYDLLNRSR